MRKDSVHSTRIVLVIGTANSRYYDATKQTQ